MGNLTVHVDGNAPDQTAITATAAAKQVTMVYKNHLDIGFTESVAKVTHDAIHWMLPEAINLDRRCRDHGRRFCWTTPSWVIWEALEINDAAGRAIIEEGIADGSLAWHALPFTTHTELLDPHLLDVACSFSRRLDQRFGLQTRCAKLTDVPGHSIGLVPALCRAGVELLHIGVNHMSATCDLPPAFRWRCGDDAVTVFYTRGYGGTHQLPGDERCLLWRMVGDNCEVPSLEDVLADHRRAEEAFPGATVSVGRMDDYLGDTVAARIAALPVIEAELGDSWIHGTGSDPWKSQRFRALQRLHRDWLQARRLDRDSPRIIDFGKHLCLITEHTWGVNFNAHNHHDNQTWNNADFDAIRHRGHIRVIEGSWQEQRDELELACAALPADLRAEADQALAACAPQADDDGWQTVDPTQTIVIGRGEIAVDGQHGAISSYLVDGQERCAGLLGAYRYQTFDHDDCLRFCRSYNHGDLRLEEFTKLGLAASDARSAWHQARLQACQRRGQELRCILEMPQDAHDRFGAPERVIICYRFATDADRIDCSLRWLGKRATRLPEASWWTFQPTVVDAADWRLDKCGQWIDPHAVIARGGRELHGVDSGARNGGVRLTTLDAHLIAPGQPQLYRFDEGPVDCSGGMHLNLHNNCWGTNFVMWCDDDLHFRASITWDG